MRIAIVQFPGSNCERETILAVKRAGMTPVSCLWNEVPDTLRSMDGYILTGGFSYEDRARAGIIAALQPLMQVIKQESETGKPVLGICNGAQILVETGLVPGFSGYPLGAALTHNKRIREGNVLGTGFYNAWINLKPHGNARPNAFTRNLSSETCLTMPVAHGEGRFVMTADMLAQIQREGLIAFQYCDVQGNIIQEFPANPNGSMDNIAALCNPAGNVMAMMPHPERCPHGDAIFLSMKAYIEEGYPNIKHSIRAAPVHPPVRSYHCPAEAFEMRIALVINDNEAFTVENTLRHLGLSVRIQRHTHWEVQCESRSVLHQIQASGVLFNDQKEYLDVPQKKNDQRSFLIKAKDACVGRQKMQHLQHHFRISGIQSIQHGVLWHIQADPESLDRIVQEVLASNILYNPLSHECYDYEYV